MNTTPKNDNAVNCGNCDGLYRLPPGISGKATIVCPHCETEVKISDLIAMLPVARISSDSGNEDESPAEQESGKDVVPRSKYAIDEQSYSIPKPFKTALRSRHHRNSSDKNQSQNKSSKTSKSTRRVPFGKKKTGPMDFVKMACGGLLAIPIAQIILWWVFAVDPFQMVDRVYPYVPAIVPQKLVPVGERTIRDNSIDENRDMPPGQTLNDIGVPPQLK